MGTGADPGDLTPRQIVEEIDKYVIGQARAKRSVAIALRNRYRRQNVPGEFREEIAPKNILMMGPTGVGKTEIARRVARLVDAPFVKVEATKFTEVGYVGRDVDAMVRDLVETSIRIVKAKRMEEVKEKAALNAEERLLDLLAPLPRRETARNPFEAIFGGQRDREHEEGYEARLAAAESAREDVRARLAGGLIDDQIVDVEIDENATPLIEVFDGANVSEMGINMQDLFGGMFPRKKKRRRVGVPEARQLLAAEEAQKLIDMDAVSAEAVRRAEQTGIIFIDEMDKIAGREGGHGPDVSREGVQRDLLPIVEGSTVMTKYGPVKTDHVLFIAAGAFHSTKPSDLVPELQGRFPIRVELEALGKEEFIRILTEPKNALVKQYQALLATEDVDLRFLPEAVDEIAGMAARVNEQTENIGARRLHTIMERLLEDLLFGAPESAPNLVVVDRAYVRAKLEDVVASIDVSKYIL